VFVEKRTPALNTRQANSSSGEADPVLTSAVQHCCDHGILIVAAAGNDGCNCPHVPVALAGDVAVAAMTIHGEPVENSNWGHLCRSGGLLAPGANLLAAVPGGGVATVRGDSFAAAIVSGVVGLILSVARARQFVPEWPGSQGHFA
jgi:subtilisin family serine protease